jgi:hypothetical protein
MKRLRFPIAVRALLAALVFSSISAFAQSDLGSIVGYAKDPSGGVVAGAKVTVKNQATGAQVTTETNHSGYFVVPNVQPGLYTLQVEASGFKRYDSVDNKLDPDATLKLDAALTVGAATDTVEVTASTQTLQTESAAVDKLVTRAQIDALELNGRDPLFLASLQPGVRSGTTLGDFTFSLTSGGYAINGARSPDTTITFDGAPAVRTRANGTSIGVADEDSTQEVQVLTADYSAEYGRAAGGQIRIVTKGGTQEFHGSAYEYFRNSALNANTWSRNQSTFTNFQSPFRYNDFGFSLGGPVIVPHVIAKGKMFFFVGQEWARYRNGQTQTQEVPSALMRQGNFSELLGANIFYNKVVQLKDPSGNPIPNNIIPANLLSKNGMAIINAYPATNGLVNGNQNWIAQASQPENQRKETINSDILPSEKDRIQFRRTALSYYELDPFDQGTNLTPKSFNRPNQAGSLAWIRVITPTLINEARITVSLDDVYIPVITSAPGFNAATDLGISYPYLLPQNKDIPSKIPTVNLPNFYGLAGGPYPSHSTGPIYTASDTITKVWGNHTIKAGAYFEKSGENDGDQINVSTVPGGSNNQNGTFTFTDDKSGAGIANLAMGLADTYTEIGQRAYTIYRGFLYEWFAQDSWKVTPKMHIDYGVRQTITIPYKALWGNQVFFDPALYDHSQAPQINPTTGNEIVGTGNQYDGMVIPGSSWPSYACGHGVTQACGSAFNGLFHGYPSYYGNINYQFQPRVGVAYSLDSKTVLRAGAGRYLTRFGLLDNIFPGANSPFQPFVTVSNVSVDNPGAGLGGAATPPLTVTTLARNNKPPEAWNWNFTVQREIFFKSQLEVAYVGHRGLHLPEVFDINQPTVGAKQANPGINVNYLRPYAGFASIQMEEDVATSTYHSLQITWNRRLASGLAFGFTYTLSKSMDGNSNYRDIVPDTYNTTNLWGPSEFDTRHMAVINVIYTLPFFRTGSASRLLGGWQLSGIMQFQTGTPCGIGSNNDYAGVGEFGSFGCGNQGQFWVMNGRPQILGQFSNSTASPNQYFSTTNGSGQPIFTAPPAGTFNLQPGVRDSIYQPGFQDWNAGLYKKFAIRERAGFEFRAEAFDLPNHPNWSGPGLNPTSSSFGKVTGKTGLARNLQLSLRFYF